MPSKSQRLLRLTNYFDHREGLTKLTYGFARTPLALRSSGANRSRRSAPSLCETRRSRKFLSF